MSGPNQVADKELQGGTLAKLFTFSISLAVVPIASYFLTQKYVWAGDTTASALTAVFLANVVLGAYIIVSVREENKARATTTTTTGETKKTQ
ncbi:hypothetical protein BDM02DRAFT_3188534 [Thelephora ganbajun]|uniref:Uncharacterized protein n=1 Tax=Thelephora ganbajun TaxID=370292 RepID=A0ACB6ZAU4_THEGA|nr:hypothetical protein BDM02DRAFT_3188534 [Thelephora ganbajun]